MRAESPNNVDQSGLGSIWYDDVAPQVSIVILNLNKSALTIECLQHLWRHTTGHTYEIVVVDNGSTDTEFAYLADYAGLFRLVRLKKNRYFGEGNNIGVEASKGKYIVFLNNDAFVTESWLEPLIEILELVPGAGGVGPKFLYPDGRLQEAGAFLEESGVAIQRGKFYELTDWELNTATIVDYCSAACFATTRNILDRISGFDATFEPAYYEDADLCLKIASLGLFIYYCPDSEIVHIENATSGNTDVRKFLTNIVENNKRKFLARWGEYLTARHHGRALSPKPLTPLVQRRRQNSGAPIAAFYSPYDLTPGGGERYILTAAAAVCDDYQTSLVTEWPYSSYRLDYLERELSLDLSRISIINRDALVGLDVSVFLSMGNHALPGAPAMGRRNFYMCQFPFPAKDAYVAGLWSALHGYDAVLLNSEFSRRHYFARTNAFQFQLPLIVLPPPVPLVESHGPKRHDKPTIISIGRFFRGGHNKRQDVLIDAVKLLNDRGVECELHLVGSIQPGHADHFDSLARRASGLPIKLHPNASPKVLTTLLSQAQIYWHATGYGVDPELHPEQCEHFGISIVEAMSAGCVPFVVDNGGPPEFVSEADTGFLYRDVEELVSKTQSLIGDSDLLRTLSSAAAERAKMYSESEFMTRWRSILAANL